MKRHFILNGFVFVQIELTQPNRNNTHSTLHFRAHVYRLKNNPKSIDLLGVKLKDDVEVCIPDNTPFIVL